jgi:hypothetical protein
MPIPGFTDGEPTGAIKAKETPNPFDASDWPIVEPVLRATMRAEATAEPMSWNNPQTGHRGRIRPVASAFKREGALCRVVIARIEATDGDRSLEAVGCNRDGGAVAISDVAPWKGL